jgi:hypothetical protein
VLFLPRRFETGSAVLLGIFTIAVAVNNASVGRLMFEYFNAS